MLVSQRIPFNDLTRVYQILGGEVEREVISTLRSGWWLNGSKVQNFAELFSAYLGGVSCFPVANGTDALEIAVKVALALQPGKREIVTVANAGGYASTAIYAAGATPVYVDVDSETHVLDIASVPAALSEGTLEVVATHLYGNVVDVPSLRAKLQEVGRQNILIIEDCAQSHGAFVGTQKVGSMGDMAAFSFYPTKNLGAMGDADAIATKRSDAAEIIKSLRQYGWQKKYEIVHAGGRNSRMDELQAAILTVSLRYLEEFNAQRKEILGAYRAASDGVLRFVHAGRGAVVHLAVAVTNERNEFISHMTSCGVATEIHYPILDCDQPGWQHSNYRIGPAGLSVSRTLGGKIVSLPCFAGMTKHEVGRLADAISSFKLS